MPAGPQGGSVFRFNMHPATIGIADGIQIALDYLRASWRRWLPVVVVIAACTFLVYALIGTADASNLYYTDPNTHQTVVNQTAFNTYIGKLVPASLAVGLVGLVGGWIFTATAISVGGRGPRHRGRGGVHPALAGRLPADVGHVARGHHHPAIAPRGDPRLDLSLHPRGLLHPRGIRWLRPHRGNQGELAAVARRRSPDVRLGLGGHSYRRWALSCGARGIRAVRLRQDGGLGPGHLKRHLDNRILLLRLLDGRPVREPAGPLRSNELPVRCRACQPLGLPRRPVSVRARTLSARSVRSGRISPGAVSVPVSVSVSAGTVSGRTVPRRSV